MSELVRFLERMGQDPSLSRHEFSAEDAELRLALREGDSAGLSRLLGGRTQVHCGLVTPD